jgi:ribosomal protein S18 acetylase RimI-like enzyme
MRLWKRTTFPQLPKEKDVLKLTQGLSKIVGFARFLYPRQMTACERAAEGSNPFGPLPEGATIELCQEFFEKLEQYEAKHLDRENTYCESSPLIPCSDLISAVDISAVVNYLTVLPEYHRRGIGKLLIDVCLKVADEAHANTFLIATPAGTGLYRKLGFKEINRLSWDTNPYGGDGVVTWLCMTRKSYASELNEFITAAEIQNETTKQTETKVIDIRD